jgi:hypothetical protein
VPEKQDRFWSRLSSIRHRITSRSISRTSRCSVATKADVAGAAIFLLDKRAVIVIDQNVEGGWLAL